MTRTIWGCRGSRRTCQLWLGTSRTGRTPTASRTRGAAAPPRPPLSSSPSQATRRPDLPDKPLLQVWSTQKIKKICKNKARMSYTAHIFNLPEMKQNFSLAVASNRHLAYLRDETTVPLTNPPIFKICNDIPHIDCIINLIIYTISIFTILYTFSLFQRRQSQLWVQMIHFPCHFKHSVGRNII